jgi:cysteine desulfurase
VADLVGADPKEIIFTSGATESNNLAIKGVANFYKDKKKHIITTQTERALSLLQVLALTIGFGLCAVLQLLKHEQCPSDACVGAATDKCVLDSCRYMQQRGWDVTYLPVQQNGLIDMDQLKNAIRPDTAIVSIMHVNNEIGVLLIC